jgi:hypothetical protein
MITTSMEDQQFNRQLLALTTEKVKNKYDPKPPLKNEATPKCHLSIKLKPAL